jgi:hypothetical protein
MSTKERGTADPIITLPFLRFADNLEVHLHLKNTYVFFKVGIWGPMLRSKNLKKTLQNKLAVLAQIIAI